MNLSILSQKRAVAGVVLMAFLAFGHLEAAVIAYDQFGYSTGSAVGLNGGGGFSGAYTTTSGTNEQIVSPGLTYTDGSSNVLNVSGNAVYMDSTNQNLFRTPTLSPDYTDSGVSTLWVSYLVKYTGNTAGYAGVSLFSGTSEKILLGKPGGQTTWGVYDAQTGTSISSSSSVTSATTYLVYKLDFTQTTTTVSLFVNPVLTSTPTTASATTTVTAFAWDKIRIATSRTATFDELAFASNFSDLVTVPEPSTYCFLVLGFGMLFAAKRRNWFTLAK